VRYRDWLDLHPTQVERKAMRAALRSGLIVPPGVTWIVWTLKAAVPGFDQVGVCHLKNHRYWSILRRS
jgi:hypothetical protein